jgi:carbonic anhydrase
MNHHESISAKLAPNQGAGDSGVFDVVESTEGQFQVYEGGFCHHSDCGSIEAARKAAEEEAAAFDGRALEDLKRRWRNDPNWDIEDTEGFEDFRQALYAYRLETELAAAKKELERMRSILLPFGSLLDELRRPAA